MFIPVVFWVASTERDILHLEEVTTSIKLEEREALHTQKQKQLLFICFSFTLQIHKLKKKKQFLSMCILPSISVSYLLGEVILVLQTHDQLHSLQAYFQLTQRRRTEMHCPLPRHGNLQSKDITADILALIVYL